MLVSGLTVMTAMAGMFLTGDPVFESFAIATIAVVAIAMIGSLTVLPALLSRLGDRVDRGRVPLVGRLRRDNGEGRIWGAIVNGVLRRPLLSAVLAGGLLVALAIPALQMQMVKPGPDTFPQSLPAVQTYERMQQAFPGSALPASVVVKAPDVNSQEMQSAIQRLRQRAVATGRMHEPITVEVNDNGTVAEITVPIDGKGTDSASNASLAQLRDEIVPTTVGALPGRRGRRHGATAQWKDSTDEMKANLPIVVGFVLLLAFSLMLVAFRSPVIAVKAIVLNLLSVAAAYGVLVLVFQHGYGSDFLGFTPTGGIDPVVPLLLFVILFGLSMDYHVFLLSRIREAVQGGMSTDEAVAKGIKSTAGVVTSAAIVMVGVFAVFATLSMLMFKQFGVGLATAILLDATIVRGVLLPASMKLLGDWNWYLPRWLEWLPRFDVSESEPPAEPQADPGLRLDHDPHRPPGRTGPGVSPAKGTPQMTAATPRQKPLTRSRIVALAIIGLAVLGLAYLRFAPDAGPVSVPKGAHAGDLILESCTYATEDGGYEADCGTLVVPENRADPKSRLIALPVTRIHARSDHPAEPIFRLEGGPGITNTQFKDASRFAADHDVVLVGYRGMDGSVRLDCPEVESALKHSTDLLDETSFRQRADAFHACADRLTADGVDLAGYSLPQRVDDLEAARKALGYDRIDLLSESAGTRTAMIYSWRYPKSIHRSVMIGANPPGHFLWDAKTTGEQIHRYAALCAQDESCRSRTPDLAASIHSASGNIPERWLFLPIKEGNVKAAAFFGLMAATTDGAGPLASPWTIDTLLSAQQGDGGGAWFLSLMAQVAFPSEQLWGDVAAVARTDAADAHRFFATGADKGSVFGSPGTDLIWAGGDLLDAWPANPDENMYGQVRDSNVETLVIGGELDVATPPQWASRDLLPHLPNGREVVLDNIGHTNDFWTFQPEAGTHLINTYLATGRVDTSLYTKTSVDFTPAISHGSVAAIMLGVMLGLAALTVALAALDGAAGPSPRWLRTQEQRRAPLAVPGRARARWLAPRRPRRADDDARCRARRRAAGDAVRRPADRARDLPGLGAERPVRPGATRPGSPRRSPVRSSAPGSASTRPPTWWRSSPPSSARSSART